MSLKLIDHERNFMLEAAVQENRVVFVMTNGADLHHQRWMMRVDSTAAREQLVAFLAGIPDVHEVLPSIRDLKERVWHLEEVIQELLIYATPFNAKQAALCKDGYTSELLPCSRGSVP